MKINIYISMSESITVVSAYTTYRHLQQYCCHASIYRFPFYRFDRKSRRYRSQIRLHVLCSTILIFDVCKKSYLFSPVVPRGLESDHFIKKNCINSVEFHEWHGCDNVLQQCNIVFITIGFCCISLVRTLIA
jgi:hypothetical protein